MYNILLIVQILVALGIIGLVLIQHGKGADAGAAFGGGASGSVFGARGAGNFLSRATAILALIFFSNSMSLAWLVSNRGDAGSTSSLVDKVSSTVESSTVEASTGEAAAPAVDMVPSDVPGAPDVASPSVMMNDVPDAEPAALQAPSVVPTSPANDVPSPEGATTTTPTMMNDVPATEENNQAP